MSATGLLSKVQSQGIRLSAIDGKLVVDAPVGVITPSLRAELVKHKADLLRQLTSAPAQMTPTPTLEEKLRGWAAPLSLDDGRILCWLVADEDAKQRLTDTVSQPVLTAAEVAKLADMPIDDARCVFELRARFGGTLH
jgi:hypothetical protein